MERVQNFLFDEIFIACIVSPLMNGFDSSFVSPVIPPGSSRRKPLRAVFEIIMVSGIVSSALISLLFAAIFGRERLNLFKMDIGFFMLFMLSESVVTFLILWTLMKMRRETFATLGLRWKRWKKHVLAGVAAAPGLILVSVIIGAVFRVFFPEHVPDKNPLMAMINSPRDVIFFIITVILAGGIKEELQRAFILRRFRRHLGGACVGLFVWSIAFGLGHYAQGVPGVCAAAILGFIFGVLYLMRGNLILPITAHSAYNTLTLLIYWFAINSGK